MKFSLLFIFGLSFQALAINGYSQEKINLDLKNTTLVNIFKVIEKTADYRFVYGDDVLGYGTKVNIYAKDATLDYVMQKVLQNTNLIYKIVDKNLVVIVNQKQKEVLYSQVWPLQGTVLDDEQKPLQGATVSIQNTGKAVLTDAQGKFTIEAGSPDDLLIISHIGYKTKTIIVGTQRDFVINLEQDESAREMSEVVVTAFGIQRQKRSLGYAAQVLDGDKLTTARELNVANSLKGQVAGVYVAPANTGAGGSSYVDIRGASSLKGNNQPLYVVDGVPIDNQTIGAPDLFNDMGKARDYGDGIGNILPDDIDNITVLKGPNAAALYGVRGANGVILITTKKGKSGKANIDFNSSFTIESPNVYPKYQQVWGQGYDNSYDHFYNKVTIDGQEVDEFPGSWLVDNWGAKYDGRPVALDMWHGAGILKYSPTGEDNLRKFYQNGSTFTNALGISGGSEKGNYRFSVSDMHNSGIYPTSTLGRQTFNLRAGLNATDKLYLEGKVNYIRQKGVNRPGNGIDINTVQFSLARIPAFVSLDLLKNYKTEDGQSNNWADGRPFNPYWILNEFLSNDNRDRVIGYMLGKYQFAKWLSLQVRGGTDFYTDHRFSRIGVNTPTGYNNLRKGEVFTNEIHVKEDNLDALLTATGPLSNNLTGNLTLGANHLNRREDYTSLEGFNLNVPGLYNIANAGLIYPTNNYVRKQMYSGFFTGQLGYKNYLFLDITGRNDWSSTLGVNNYSFFYPSASISYVFSDAWQTDKKNLSYGKLRISYAQAGNDAAPYLTQIGYYLSNTTFNGQQFASIMSDVPLANLKNELTTSFEIGTELKFFENRLGVDFTYYNASTKNQIVPTDISAATGYATKLINAGKIDNKGFEVLLTASPVRGKNFNWQTTLNFSRNRSQVVELAPNVPNLTLISGGGNTVSIEARVGKPYGDIVGYAFKRAPDGQRWLSAEGTFQRDDTVSVLGNIQPDFLAGITNTFSYKGFTLSGLVDIRKGGQIFSNTKSQQMASGTGKFTENGDNLVSNGVIEDANGGFHKNTLVIGRMAYYTAMGWGDISEAYIIPADYVSLRELSLGYNIGRLFKKPFLKMLRLSLVGRNLFYLYRNSEFKVMGISPEAAFGPSTMAQGYENPGTPSTRSIGLNLSISF